MPQWPGYPQPISPYDSVNVRDLFPTQDAIDYFASLQPQEQMEYLRPALGWYAGSDAARMASQRAASNYWLNRLYNPQQDQPTESYAQWMGDRMQQGVRPDYGWSGRQQDAMRRLAEASQLGELGGQIAVTAPTAAEQRGIAQAALGTGLTPWAQAALNRRLDALLNEYRANTSLAPTFLNFLRQRGVIADPDFTDPTAQSPYGGNAPDYYDPVTGQGYPAGDPRIPGRG